AWARSNKVTASALFGDREDHRPVLEGQQAVAGRGEGDEIAAAALPFGIAAGQPDTAAQDEQGRLAGALVVGQAGAGGQREKRLAQGVFVAAVDGGGAAPVGRGGGALKVFAGQGVERELLHGLKPSRPGGAVTRAMRGTSWRPPPSPGRPYRRPAPP